MARTFDLSDIIADEVKKALTKQASTQSAGGLGDISIQDITKFLAELSKLKKQSEALAPAPVQAVPAQTRAVAAPAPASAPTKPSPVNVYNAVIATIDKVVPILGDMRLSEVKTYMTENKDAVISLIEANL